MNNHWIEELKRDHWKQLLHESHIAIWRFKSREESAIAQGNWAAANIAAMNVDSEKELYGRIKKRLADCS